jgi:hypothetical protein
MKSPDQKFSEILRILREIGDLLAEADKLIPEMSETIVKELYIARVGRTQPAQDKATPQNEPPPGVPEQAAKEEQHSPALSIVKTTAKHAYEPRPEGPLKGKTLNEALEEIMRTRFTKTTAVMAQILTILADQGFDGFTGYDIEDPMKAIRKILADHPDVARPNQKNYQWKPGENSPPSKDPQEPSNPPPPEEQQPSPGPVPANPDNETEQHQPDKEGAPPADQAEQPEQVSFYELTISNPHPGEEPTDNGEEEL